MYLEGSTVIVPSNRIEEALGKGSKTLSDDPGAEARPGIDLFRLTWAGDQIVHPNTKVPQEVFHSYNALIAHLTEKSEWGEQRARFDGVQVRLVANMDSVDSHFLLSGKPEYGHLFVVGSKLCRKALQTCPMRLAEVNVLYYVSGIPRR